jgi:predicted dehydrogenase
MLIKQSNAILVGFGYWGPVLARNISQSEHFNLYGILDSNENKRASARKLHPSARIFSNLDEISPEDIDVAFIATPSSTHFSISQFFLEKGIHVWVEKPACLSAIEAETLCKIAENTGAQIVVDHPYVVHPGTEKIKELLRDEVLGKVFYFESTRANLGIFQPDVSVLWDLVVHDLSILNTLFPDEKPKVISSTAFNPLSKNSYRESMISVQLQYSNNVFCNLSSNWLSPIKVRRITIGGQLGTVVFDDTESIEKIRIYNQEFKATQTLEETREMLISYISGDISSPRVSGKEPIAIGMDLFGKQIREGIASPNNLHSQLNVIRTLEEIQRKTVICE